MKKPSFYIILIFITSFIGLFPISASAEIFNDVSLNEPYYDAVEYLADKEIVSGYKDGSFRPSQNISRIEFLKILLESQFGYWMIEDCEDRESFSDIYTEWQYPYACFAKKKEIISGYEDGSFRPNDTIRFAEASKIIVETFDYLPFTYDDWWEGYIRLLEGRQAIPVSINDVWKPVSRAEMSEMIYRLKRDKQSRKSGSFYSDKTVEHVLVDFMEHFDREDNIEKRSFSWNENEQDQVIDYQGYGIFIEELQPEDFRKAKLYLSNNDFKESNINTRGDSLSGTAGYENSQLHCKMSYSSDDYKTKDIIEEPDISFYCAKRLET